MPSMDALIRLEELTKRHDSDAAPAVDGVSMQIASGESVAVMGQSGVAGQRTDWRDASETWCEALFASWLQPSDTPTAEKVAEAITIAMQYFGVRGCVGRMVQEFGDHPEAAAERMRWVRRLAAERTLPGGRK